LRLSRGIMSKKVVQVPMVCDAPPSANVGDAAPSISIADGSDPNGGGGALVPMPTLGLDEVEVHPGKNETPTIGKKLEVLDHFEGLTNVKHREQETMNAYVGVLRSRGQIFRWREACKIQRWRDLPPDIAQKLKDNVSECLHVYIYIYTKYMYISRFFFIYIYMQLLHTLYI